VKPGVATNTRRTPRRASRVSTASVYGFSHSSRPNNDWNDIVHRSRGQPIRRTSPRAVRTQWVAYGSPARA
jgi:hypothetical protein